MAFAKNIAVHVAEDDVSLTFTTQDGRFATINVGQLAAQLGGEARVALLAWCEDRKRDVPPQSLGEQKRPLLAQDYTD